jgi:hypothetical protein
VLVIDAYNVLWAADTVGAAGPPGLEQLAGWLGRSRYAERETVLVCDGRPPPWLARRAPADAAGLHRGLLGGVKVLFAGPGRDADALIEELVEAHRSRGGLLVVSSDGRVRQAARRAQADVISSLDFLRELAADRARGRMPGKPAFASQVPLDAGSTAWWIRQFGLGADAADTARGPAGPGADAPTRTESEAPARAPPMSPSGLPAGLRPHDPGAAAGVNPSVDRELWALGLSPDDLDMERWLRLDISPSAERTQERAPGSGPAKRPGVAGRRAPGPERGRGPARGGL